MVKRIKIKTLFLLFLAVMVIMSLIGCGGGGGSSSNGGSGSTNLSKYAGSYSGTYAGGDNGTWSITIDASGNISGTAHSNIFRSDESISGTVTSSGVTSMTIGTSSGGSTFDGTIDSSGKLIGTWNNIQDGTHGTFTSQAGSSTSTGPKITSFTMPSTSASLTVPITSFTAYDSTGITGYYLSVSATTPSLNASDWSSAPFTSVTFSSAGSHTVYAWVKNAAGQISSSVSDSVIITITSNKSTYSCIDNTYTSDCVAYGGSNAIYKNGIKCSALESQYGATNGNWKYYYDLKHYYSSSSYLTSLSGACVY